MVVSRVWAEKARGGANWDVYNTIRANFLELQSGGSDFDLIFPLYPTW